MKSTRQLPTRGSTSPSWCLTKASLLLFAIICVWAQSGSARETPRSGEVRSIGNRLLWALGDLQAADAPEQSGLRAEAVEASELIHQRAAALAALVEENPAAALRLSLPSDVAARLSAAFPAAAAQIESHGTWEGPIEYLIEDDWDFASHRTHRILSVGGETLSVHFAGVEPDGLKSGDVLRVQGVRVGNVLAASDARIVAAAASSSLTCSTIGAQKSIVLLVTMPGISVDPPITISGVSDTFFSSEGPSLSDYWLENSYGQTWAEGDVKGWYELDRAYTCDSFDEMLALRAAAIAAAESEVDFTQYTRLFIIPNGWPASCINKTRATFCEELSSADGSFTASTSWMTPYFFDPDDQEHNGVQFAAHTAGHNLGLLHANARDFGYQPLGPPGDAGAAIEYGDLFSTMGLFQTPAYLDPRLGLGHYGTPHKLQLGWLAPEQVQTVTTDGSYSVEPTEVAGSVKTLRIVRGTERFRGQTTTNYIWLEYRRPLPELGNYDTTLYPQIFTGGLVHYEDRQTPARTTQLLDFTPNSGILEPTDPPGLADGLNPALVGEWVDPYTGISITTSNPTDSALDVDVAFGPLSCVSANPAVTLSPSNPSAISGAGVVYTVSVTNNDTVVCANRTFNLASALPSGWPTSFSPPSLTLAPTATGTVSMTKTVPVGTADGLFDVDATATSTDEAHSGTGLAGCTVAPPILMVVTLSPLGIYPKNSTVPIVANVTRTDSSQVAGASVTFSVTSPGGGATTKTVIADGAGRAAWNYIVGKKAATGLYRVGASATFSSESANAVPVNFTVSP